MPASDVGDDGAEGRECGECQGQAPAARRAPGRQQQASGQPEPDPAPDQGASDRGVEQVAEGAAGDAALRLGEQQQPGGRAGPAGGGEGEVAARGPAEAGGPGDGAADQGDDPDQEEQAGDQLEARARLGARAFDRAAATRIGPHSE